MSEIVMTSPAAVQAPTKKKEAILAYRAANPGATANDIVKALGANLQYVYSVLRGKKIAKKSRAGRPRKNISPLQTPVFKRENPELSNLRIAVSEHAHIVDGLKKEIDELTVIIAYLEHRCAKAEHHRGLAI